jgi:hypothetical protein
MWQITVGRLAMLEFPVLRVWKAVRAAAKPRRSFVAYLRPSDPNSSFARVIADIAFGQPA